ncbi:MAG TPA: TetR/AcrR family transcriptional regulator [Bacteroidales bacterium]|nr:TetR/AcrR family transcriptional regulator [Bacteroidales bacterium]
METEVKILSQTLEIFKARGIKKVTMDEISSELGMSKRTIYELFRDRENLVYKTLEYGMLQEQKDLMAIISEASNVIEALYLIGKDGQMKRGRINVLFFEDIRKYYMAFFDNSPRGKDIRNFEITFALLERGIREGIFLDDLNLEVVNSFIQEMMNLVHNLEIIPDFMERERLIIHNIFLPYFRGISTQKGRELLEAYFTQQNQD